MMYKYRVQSETIIQGETKFDVWAVMNVSHNRPVATFATKQEALDHAKMLRQTRRGNLETLHGLKKGFKPSNSPGGFKRYK